MHCLKNAKGQSLVQVLVATAMLSIVTMGVVTVSQEMNKTNSRAQDSAVLASLRNRLSPVARDIPQWMGRMRSASGLISGCLPDGSSAAYKGGNFSCPSGINPASLDPQIKALANTLTVSSTPLVDLMGEALAGTEANPLYLDSNGRSCSGGATAGPCRFVSVGYLIRTNSGTSGNPGAVRFAIRVSKNTNNPATNNIALKPLYDTIEVGTEWSESPEQCPTGTFKVGYLSNGKADCRDPFAAACSSDKVFMGYDSDKKPICLSVPTCPKGQSAGYDISSASFQCSGTACAAGLVFQGYSAGTGDPICTATSLQSCPTGSIQVGVKQEVISGKSVIEPICKSVQTCTASQSLVMDSSGNFVCQNNSSTGDCPAGQYAYGVNANRTPKCQSFSAMGACGPGTYLAGINGNGSLNCQALPATAAPASTGCNGFNTDPNSPCGIDHPVDVQCGWISMDNVIFMSADNKTQRPAPDSGKAYKCVLTSKAMQNGATGVCRYVQTDGKWVYGYLGMGGNKCGDDQNCLIGCEEDSFTTSCATPQKVPSGYRILNSPYGSTPGGTGHTPSDKDDWTGATAPNGGAAYYFACKPKS
jgi:hypothetical protein